MKTASASRLLAASVFIVAALVATVAVLGSDIGIAGSAVIQGLSVVVSIYGGVVFARQGNDDAIVSAAVKSVRRVLVNYNSLGRLAAIINRLRFDLEARAHDGKLELQTIDLCLAQLSDLVVEQISSADIAVRDWQDLAPSQVAEELRQFEARQKAERESK